MSAPRRPRQLCVAVRYATLPPAAVAVGEMSRGVGDATWPNIPSCRPKHRQLGQQRWLCRAAQLTHRRPDYKKLLPDVKWASIVCGAVRWGRCEGRCKWVNYELASLSPLCRQRGYHSAVRCTASQRYRSYYRAIHTEHWRVALKWIMYMHVWPTADVK